MAENGGSGANSIAISISKPELTAPVLERLVSAAAVQASFPVDRLINALAAVDALVEAAGTVLDGETRHFEVRVGEGEVELAIESLHDGDADAVLRAARMPAIGDVLERMASSIETEQTPDGAALVMRLS